MDLFLEETDAFRDKPFIEKEDFTDLFGQAIMKARNEATYQHLAPNVSINRYDSQTSIGLVERSLTQSQYASALSHYQSHQIMEVLGDVVKNGFQNDVMQALTHIGEISTA